MITPEQCRAGRAWLNWSQEELSTRSNVAMSTVRDFEKGKRIPIDNNIVSIQAALEKAGVHPVSQHGEPDGIRFDHRVREQDTYMPVLEFLDDSPKGFLSTSDLITALESYLPLTSQDTAILTNRSDTRFSQIVRNIVSHRETAGNIIQRGWVTYEKHKRGLRITPEGRARLASGPPDWNSAP